MNSQNRQMNSGETMFEYLRKKKKSLLEGSLNRDKLYSRQQSIIQRNISRDQNDYQSTKRCGLKQTNSKSTAKEQKVLEDKSNTLKMMLNICEQRKPVTRSFLQMISPVRSKSPIQKQVENNLKVSPKLKKQTYKDNYTKKNLMEKMNKIRDVIESLSKEGKFLKEKCHFLFVDLKPYFKHIQHCGDSKFQKRTEQIKAHIKAIQPIFSEFNLQSTRHDLDTFFKNFSEYLNELEGNSLAEIQQNKSNLCTEITTRKNGQIADLKDLNRKMERQLNYMKKTYQKLENNYQQFSENTSLELITKSSEFEEKSKKYQQLKQILGAEKNQLRNKNEELKIKVSELQNQIKKHRVEREKYQQQCLNTITKVKSEQEQFLLNQILVLKKQFHSDLTQMASLHKIRQDQLLKKVKELSINFQHNNAKCQQMVQANLQMQQALNSNKAQATRFKKQNECLATDMHRINEELYHHWLALKDIRTLSTRLDIYYKFKKIYEELGFNQLLFL